MTAPGEQHRAADRAAALTQAAPLASAGRGSTGAGFLNAWLHLSGWMVQTPWVVWSLVAINLVSSVAGYIYWYGSDILAAPLYIWPFVPDSPLSATLWAVALLAFHKGRRWSLLGLLAATGSIKYGLWTDWVWLTNAIASGGTYDLEAVVLSLNHFGMAIEGVLLLPLLLFRLRHVVPVILWYAANDLVDYVLGYRPKLPNPESLDLIAAFAFGTTAVLGILWLLLAWRLRAKGTIGEGTVEPQQTSG